MSEHQPQPTPADNEAASAPVTPPPTPIQPPLPPQGHVTPVAPGQAYKQASPFARGLGLGAGAGIGVAGTLGVLALVGSLLSALMMLGFAGALAGAGQTSVEGVRTVWGPETATAKLRAIEISGPIMAESSGATLTMGTYGYEVAEVIDKIKTEDAGGLVLLINTPGGTINGSRAIADAVERYQARTGKKAVAYVQGLSASGGMYAMAGVDEIVADHGSLIGSIGVIAGPFERYKDVKAVTGSLLTSGIATDGGITVEYLTQGRDKDFGNPFRDMTAEERAVFTNGLANEYNGFVDWVSKGRGIPAQTIKDDLGAHIFDVKTAKEKKLIDNVMGRDEAFRHFATLAGLDPANTKVIAAQPPSPFAQLFGVQARVYGQALPARGEGGQPARATASLCTGAVSVLAYAGSIEGVCR